MSQDGIDYAKALTEMGERASTDPSVALIQQHFQRFLSGKMQAIDAKRALLSIARDAFIGAAAMDLIDAGSGDTLIPTPVAQQVDATDLKSVSVLAECQFDSGQEHTEQSDTASISPEGTA